MNLVIVESPAKAKTIEGYLGKDYVVKSSYGHVRDLPTKGLSVDLENNFKPDYTVMADKKKVITELKKLSKEADVIWLATDEDREGEAISWHLAEALGLNFKTTKRIVFHEITKPAILKAIESPRLIDKNLVDAQQARRVLDRIVGFELSPVLWKKVKPSLSAGRVQSVTVRLIVEREKEIDAFTSEEYYRVKAVFQSNGKTFSADLNKRLSSEADALAFLEKCKNADFTVQSVDKKPGKKSPAAPFTTSTLQQEAARKLGYSVAQTMRVAQSLYEAGKITYMRTDSVNLSDTAIEGATAEINSEYGNEYLNPRKFSTKTANAQEAHEAIRPTYFNRREVSSDGREQRLYELIWKRAIASQMSDAKLLRTTIKISSQNIDELFEVKGEIITFDGFLKVYLEGSDDENEEEENSNLPNVAEGEHLMLDGVEVTQKFTNHPPRYSEAALVKKLEELGIGRPSTYAPTISTIQKRGYVVKEDREGHERKYKVISLAKNQVSEEIKTENTGAERNKMFPTDIGTVVNDFLEEHFNTIMDYHFTASVEEEFDHISRGELEWTKMLHKFYQPFHKKVEDTLENSERASGERELGTDPKSGRPVIARLGRYGPMVQIGSTEEGEEKPQFAKLRVGQSIQTIELEDALELFKLPRTVGQYQEKDIVASTGRFGPFLRFDGAFYNIGKLDPLEIDLETSINAIEEKLEAARKALIHDFENDPPIKVLQGRYGPYMTVGKENYKLPKDIDPEALTLEKCLEIAENSQPTNKGGKRTVAKAKPKAKPKTKAKK
ncbi:MAG: type I DNA topoisomerase [Salibacteraceae bacterium]|jgi:DNA topoisomerase I|nr:type I DNA topoisomerase [Salibacteraceae bacterium]MDP4686893.1 type I DNA topoisomerase [Salibacteraceae bacterium]MDP4763904.1 type I DNA topoisomerase [Salibacteraceae bacterium]MDP4844491.1 type I DNA topoisomerase [Salibacteraceae bacterium]